MPIGPPDPRPRGGSRTGRLLRGLSFATGAALVTASLGVAARRSPSAGAAILVVVTAWWVVAELGTRLSSSSPLDSIARSVHVERRLMGLLRPHAGRVAAGLGITVAITAVGLAKPWPGKILIDDVLVGGSGGSRTGPLALVVVLTLLLFLLAGGLALLQTQVLYALTQHVIRDLRGDLFAHLAGLSLRFHDTRGVGDSAYRVSADTYSIHTVLLDGLVPVTSAVLTLGGTLLVAAAIDPVLAALSFVSVPAAALVSVRYGRRIRLTSQEVHQRESDVYAHAEQTLAGIRTVQAFAREPYELQRFGRHAERSSSAMVRLVTEQTAFGLVVDAVLGLGLALVTWVAATRALDGHLTPGEVLVFLAYAGSVYGPVSDLAAVFGELETAAAGAERVFEVLDEPLPPGPPSAVAPDAPAHGDLALDHVTFGYAPEHPVVHGLSLDVPAGTTIALVGPTGAGKSTLISLMLRLYDPGEGRVLLDGADLRDLPVAWVREQVAFVPQDPVLFPTTVRENIRYGRLDATDAEVEEAAALANVLDELLADPRGLEAEVGDRGVTLSGGQRQRVAIARAFLRDAPVVLLDEPTSALDAATEALVMDATWRLLSGRTGVVIAHRLSTVHRADRVVVIEGGRVAEAGTHRSLMRRGGLYRSLHKARFGQENAGRRRRTT